MELERWFKNTLSKARFFLSVMKISHLLSIITGLSTFILAETASNGICCLPNDYMKLVDYANLVSFAYCIKKGLTSGLLGDKSTNCRLETCKLPQYSNIEIVKEFNFNDRGSVGSGYCGLDNDSKRILLVFRGTASRRDWVTNMDFVPTKYLPLSYSGIYGTEPGMFDECSDCKVHRGFYNILKTSMVPVVKKTISLIEKYPDYQLLVIGHSLGGALTFLTGLEFQLMGFNPLVVSFACPKVGNKNLMEFADFQFKTNKVAKYIDEYHDFNHGYIRVTHKGDIVPKLPPSMVYRHGGYEYNIDKKDFPHDAQSLERIGPVNNVEDEDVEADTITNPTKYWPGAFLKKEHVSYFIKISGCDDEP